MNAATLAKLLKKLGACHEAVDWTKGKTLAEAWQQCDRADWMLWLCGRMAGQEGWPTRPQIVLVACSLAEKVLPLFEKKYPNDSRPRKAIEAARAWANDPSKHAAADADARTSTAAGEAWQRERLAKLKEFSDEVRNQLTIPVGDDR